MFVRTKKGKILKCFKSESMNLPIYYVIGSKTNSYIEYQDVKKTSEDIIDILEEGDYVNGYKVITNKKEYIELNNADLNYDCIEYQRILKNKYSEIAINSIVTKEMFESMQYKVD